MTGAAADAAPTAAILIIGAEVLSGKVDDANGPFLLRALRARGVEVVEIRTIGDSVDAICAATRELTARADSLFTTGGIGPTHDDVTMAGIAKALGVAVVRHPELERRLVAKYGAPLDPVRGRLAEIPEGAEVVFGDQGILATIQAGSITILPGVPSLARLCFERIAPRLAGAPFHSRALLLATGEATIARHLAEVQRAHPAVAIGSYPRFDNAPYRVKVTIDGRDLTTVEGALAALRAGLDPLSIVGSEPSDAGQGRPAGAQGAPRP